MDVLAAEEIKFLPAAAGPINFHGSCSSLCADK